MQESELTEIIPITGISAFWGQYPAFFHLLSFSEFTIGSGCSLTATGLQIFFSFSCVIVCALVAQSCLTLCDPMNCSPPASSVHGILQAGMGCHFLQGIFPSQGSNPHLLHCRWILYRLNHQGSPGRYHV